MSDQASSGPAPPTTAVIALLHTALAHGQRPKLTISSASMTPLLRPGDQVQLAAADPTELRPGDIITVTEENTLLTHRFWRRRQQNGRFYLTTRGDRMLKFDPPHQETALLGRVVARQRGRRNLSITSGRGERLNRHLARLNGRYQRWATVPYLRPRWQRTLPVALLRLWSHLLILLVGLLAADGASQTS